MEVPDAQTVPGEWTVEISGSTARWVFHASGEEDRGGLLSGETAVFRFSATTSNADDLEVQWHLWGDFFTAEEPHTLSDIFELEHCGDVETDDDSAAGDDDDDDDDDDSGGCGW
ncbi:MAG: hypothetical protein M5R36_24975 [Deltaproteobacteria bacterium]|nr:hypothetical protein [Deltaproteobacteria bacterium]